MRGAIVLVVGISLLGACSDGDGTAADPTVPTAAPTSATSTATTVPDVATIPATIDAPYLNAVLAALDEVDGQATRLIYAQKRFTPEAADILNAVYGDDALQLEVDGWFLSLGDDAALKGIRPDPGNRKTLIDRVIVASPSCVWMAVRRDYSARNVETGPQRFEYVALAPLDASNDPKKLNPTPWMITVDGFRKDGQEPSNPCVPG